MNVFLFALAVCASGLPYSMSYDPSVVEAARAAHFNAVRRAEIEIANASPVEKKENHPPPQETRQHQLGVNVQDTPEVAAAKAAHFEAVQKAEQATAIANATSRYQHDVYVSQGSHVHHSSGAHHPVSAHHPSPVYHQDSIHHPTLVHYPNYVHIPDHHSGAFHYPTHDHHIIPTYYPDHDHHSYPTHHHHYVSGDHYYPVHTYSVPVEQTTQHKLGVNVQDTPEVAAAKIAHFEAVRQAAQSAIASSPNDDGSYKQFESSVPVVMSVSIPETPQPAAAKPEIGVAPQTTGHYVQEVVYTPAIYQPQPIPQQLGVRDTPEVAAAKAAHFAAFRQAQLVAADKDKMGAGSEKNFYANTARQYGQIQF